VARRSTFTTSPPRRPLLANRIPTHGALLGGDLAGQLIDFGDPDAAAGSIRAALEADQPDLDGLSVRLRARAADYDIARLRGQIDEQYTLLRVGPHGRRRRPPGAGSASDPAVD
jgi:hypothetical protein